MSKKTKSQPVTLIRVNGERWRVPRGFGRMYVVVARNHTRAVAEGRLEQWIVALRDMLELVGYTADPATLAAWPLRKLVEADIYAANVALRASDNPIQRHPRPEWLTAESWKGPTIGDGIMSCPSPTVIA